MYCSDSFNFSHKSTLGHPKEEDRQSRQKGSSSSPNESQAMQARRGLPSHASYNVSGSRFARRSTAPQSQEEGEGRLDHAGTPTPVRDDRPVALFFSVKAAGRQLPLEPAEDRRCKPFDSSRARGSGGHCMSARMRPHILLGGGGAPPRCLFLRSESGRTREVSQVRVRVGMQGDFYDVGQATSARRAARLLKYHGSS